MNYSDVEKMIKEFGLDIKLEFDQKCYKQYTIYLDDNDKPKCQCICNKVLAKDKYIEISNWQVEISLDEMRKYINGL